MTGPGKDSGKTSFSLALHARARSAGLRLAMLASGFDGERRDALTKGRKPAIPVFPGDLVASPERFLRESGILPEILGIVGGSTPFGPLVLARATRTGSVVLAGPEGNARLAEAVALSGEAGAELTVVDGAIDRVTMIAEVAKGAFVYAFRAERATLASDCARARRVVTLARLPLAADGFDSFAAQGVEASGRSRSVLGRAGEGRPDSPWDLHADTGIARLRGPLTAAIAGTLPAGYEKLVVDDFTKVFLADADLAVLGRRARLHVARAIPLAALVALRRGVSRKELEAALADADLIALLAGDGFDSGLAERAA